MRQLQKNMTGYAQLCGRGMLQIIFKSEVRTDY